MFGLDSYIGSICSGCSFQYCFVETGVLIILPGINPFSSSVIVFCTASFS